MEMKETFRVRRTVIQRETILDMNKSFLLVGKIICVAYGTLRTVKGSIEAGKIMYSTDNKQAQRTFTIGLSVSECKKEIPSEIDKSVFK